jgi:rubrerythrin
MDLKNIQTEIDASYLYKQLSEVEKDANVAKVFAQMSEIEMSHAVAFARKFNLNADQLPKPSGLCIRRIA